MGVSFSSVDFLNKQNPILIFYVFIIIIWLIYIIVNQLYYNNYTVNSSTSKNIKNMSRSSGSQNPKPPKKNWLQKIKDHLSQYKEIYIGSFVIICGMTFTIYYYDIGISDIFNYFKTTRKPGDGGSSTNSFLFEGIRGDEIKAIYRTAARYTLGVLGTNFAYSENMAYMSKLVNNFEVGITHINLPNFLSQNARNLALNIYREQASNLPEYTRSLLSNYMLQPYIEDSLISETMINTNIENMENLDSVQSNEDQSFERIEVTQSLDEITQPLELALQEEEASKLEKKIDFMLADFIATHELPTELPSTRSYPFVSPSNNLISNHLLVQSSNSYQNHLQNRVSEEAREYLMAESQLSSRLPRLLNTPYMDYRLDNLNSSDDAQTDVSLDDYLNQQYETINRNLEQSLENQLTEETNAYLRDAMLEEMDKQLTESIFQEELEQQVSREESNTHFNSFLNSLMERDLTPEEFRTSLTNFFETNSGLQFNSNDINSSNLENELMGLTSSYLEESFNFEDEPMVLDQRLSISTLERLRTEHYPDLSLTQFIELIIFQKIGTPTIFNSCIDNYRLTEGGFYMISEETEAIIKLFKDNVFHVLFEEIIEETPLTNDFQFRARIEQYMIDEPYFLWNPSQFRQDIQDFHSYLTYDDPYMSDYLNSLKSPEDQSRESELIYQHIAIIILSRYLRLVNYPIIMTEADMNHLSQLYLILQEQFELPNLTIVQLIAIALEYQ